MIMRFKDARGYVFELRPGAYDKGRKGASALKGPDGKMLWNSNFDDLEKEIATIERMGFERADEPDPEEKWPKVE